MLKALLPLFLSAIALSAQSSPARPAFEKFPVASIYDGEPAAPTLTKDQRMFRTVIRRGARSPVQFAGHYTVPEFGCGTGCSGSYFVDSITGRVFDGFIISDFPMEWREQHPADPQTHIQFMPSSSLVKINGCPNERDCGYYDYVMVEGKGLKLVQKWLLPKEFQE
jgi:hypothetical protein